MRRSNRAVAILPIGAIEAHGPHLPLSTDVVIAEAMARAGAERLAVREYTVHLLPALSYTAAPFASGFSGTISLRPDTVSAIIIDIARSLKSQGIRLLAIANSHLDPTHLQSIHHAVDCLREEGGSNGGADGESPTVPFIAFPDLTERRWAERLTDEFRSGACHAGRYEGSIMLAERPDWVRQTVMAGLTPVAHSLTTAIREGKVSFEEAGGARAYFGWPSDATAEEGRQSIAILGEIMKESVLEILDNHRSPE